MSRPALGSVTYCPKCGMHSDHFSTTYCGIQTFLKPPTDEWLLRTCRQCGYEWEEACLDAPTL